MKFKWSTLFNFLLFALIAYFVYIKFIRKPNYGEQEQAPLFSVYNPIQKDSIRLADFRGQYVLLDFWGSWCGPCRQANQWLVPMYHDYKDQGFDIISIGVERERDYQKWLNAIEKDALVWKHHANDNKRFKGALTKLYGIHEIPTHFLIDPEGMIVGVDLEEQAIRTILDQK